VTRLVSALLSVSMCFSFAACGQTEENKPEKEESQKQEESVKESQDVEIQEEEIPTITVAIKGSNEHDYGHDQNVIAWLEKNAGVSLEFVLLPVDATEAETKLNLMFANGDYPDVICYNMDKDRMVELGKEGIFIPLNKIYEENSVHMKSIYEENPDLYANVIAPDGNMYGFTVPNQCFHCTAYPKMLYNAEWLESLGMEVPTTTEEFKAVLLAAKESDFNGNGKKDEIALLGRDEINGNVQYPIMNYFIPCSEETLLYAKDGEVIFAADKDEFRKGLEYMKDLYDEGLIDPSSFTNDRAQEQAVVRSDDKLVFAFVARFYAQITDLANTYTNEVIVAMPPVESETGARYQQENGYVDQANYSWFITDNCENPEAAYRVGDLLMSEEGTLLQNYGAEGKGWIKLDKPVASGIDGTDAIYKIGGIDAEYDATKDLLYTDMFDGTLEMRAKSGNFILLNEEDHYTSAGFEYRLYEETLKVVDYFYPEYLPNKLFIEDEADREKFSELKVSLKEYVDSAMARFITGELDLEKGWDSYVKDIQQYGRDEYIRIYQEAYTEYYNNL